MKRTLLIIVIILGIAALGVAGWLLYRQVIKPAMVNSYADCVAAGYPILESYPEQCNTPDGKHFTNPDAQNVTPPGEFTSTKGTTITLDNVASDQRVSSPLTVNGLVPGNWSFEASFTVQVTDRSGRVLGQAAAQLEGDWMTEQDVPFSVTVQFERPASSNTEGFLVLQKANASGLPEHDDRVRVPVIFS